ncbi:hypothetical protein AAFF_G00388250 [Aldrovandia affinis]|uniref:Uncharacterized protein n=1 Tax=Aldrovandia affinis TaxID=143900 RepID=A0AAD7SEZ8_9TELE|nr:hypothetical protein AAFF_G00388250 [Aldrovandia affinis]
MAFFKSIQQSLPSVSSILDSVTDAVDDLAFAVGDVTYTASGHLATQVNTIIHKVQAEEEERLRRVEAAEKAAQEAGKDEKEAALLKELRLRSEASLSQSRDPEAYTTDYSTGSTLSTETFSTCSDLSQTTEGSRGEGASSSSARGSAGRGRESAAPDSPHGGGKSQNTRGGNERASGRERKKSAAPADAKDADGPVSPADLRSAKKGRGSASMRESMRKGSSKGDGARKETSRRNSVKDKSYPDGDNQGSSSDSEDEVMGKYQEAVTRSQGLRGGDPRHRKGYGWETRQKYSPLSAEYDGYSSEVSTEEDVDGHSRPPANTVRGLLPIFLSQSCGVSQPAGALESRCLGSRPSGSRDCQPPALRGKG